MRSRVPGSRDRGSHGWTLIELVVVLSLAMVLMLIAAAPMQQMLGRQRLEGTARQVAALLQRARLEAIKRSVPAVVRIDLETGQVVAFADIHDSEGNLGGDQVFNPLSGARPETSDYSFGVVQLPFGVSFTAPAGQAAVDGFTAPVVVPAEPGDTETPAFVYSPEGDDDDDGSEPVFDPTTSPVLVFAPNGSVNSTGAVRLADARENYLEVRVGPRATGRVQLRKWHGGDEQWRPQGGAGEAWQWN